MVFGELEHFPDALLGDVVPGEGHVDDGEDAGLVEAVEGVEGDIEGAGISDEAVVLFGEVYRMAAPALGILLGATVLFSLFVVINTVITGAGRPGVSLLLGAVAAVISAGAVSLAVLLADSFVGVLMSTALALVLSMVLAFAGALAWLLKTYGYVVPTATAARAAAAAAAGLVVAWAWQPAGLIQVVLQAAAVGLTYLATLGLTGEFTREDLRRLVGLLPGKG